MYDAHHVVKYPAKMLLVGEYIGLVWEGSTARLDLKDMSMVFTSHKKYVLLYRDRHKEGGSPERLLVPSGVS